MTGINTTFLGNAHIAKRSYLKQLTLLTECEYCTRTVISLTALPIILCCNTVITETEMRDSFDL